jgi:hypothetical protein
MSDPVVVSCPQGHSGPLQLVLSSKCGGCGYQSQAWVRNDQRFSYPVFVPAGCIRKPLPHVCGGQWLYELATVG